MGDTISVEQAKQYTQSLQFVQIQQDRNFGPIQIFRLKEPPYEYVMDYKKTFMEGDQRLKKYMQLINQIKNTEHKNLVKIHLCELREEIHMCIKDKKIHTYCNYYNFTLAEAIKKKKILDGSFPQSELIYIMSCLIEVAVYLQKFNISVGEYRPETIYLSPEGYIKLYLLELEEDNKHSCYFKALAQKDLIDEFILAPEQLAAINKMEYQIKYDIYKADIFAIAMIILELITLDKSKFYYNQTKAELKIGRIQFDLSSVSQFYSEGFLSLIKHCLQPDPRKRCSLEEANEVINFLRKSSKTTSYCIRLQDDDDKSKKTNAKKDVAMSMKGQHILNGIEKKLMPSPITTLSSSTSSSFKFDTRSTSSRFTTSQSHQIKL